MGTVVAPKIRELLENFETYFLKKIENFETFARAKFSIKKLSVRCLVGRQQSLSDPRESPVRIVGGGVISSAAARL